MGLDINKLRTFQESAGGQRAKLFKVLVLK
jgi:hypothetical protein